jgi:hypothetical protein
MAVLTKKVHAVSNQSDRPADGVNRLLDDVPIASALPVESDRIAAIAFGETQGNGRSWREAAVRSNARS